MKETRILVVDDDTSMRMALCETLESCGYIVETAANGFEALTKFKGGAFEAVITDMRMPGMGGMEVLKNIKKISPESPVILITAYGTVNTAVEAMKEGASDFIMKPFSLEDIEFVVKNVLATQGEKEEKESRPERKPSIAGREIITRDEKMLGIFEFLKAVAKSRSSVLIQGESGTGKELFARFLYRHSDRKHMPFVAINCAAIPENLLESEMFGYEKGAFTGAMQRKIGKFELANGGTLLLDEITEMSPHLQAKLLRVIQEKEIDRVGGKMPLAVDVRIIATTNADIRQAIEDKTFREDLYYRLNVIPLKIPPLRERKGDIELLSRHFLEKYADLNDKPLPSLADVTLKRLQAYDWPGNVRELENVVERAVLICPGDTVLPEHLYLEENPSEDLSAEKMSCSPQEVLSGIPELNLSGDRTIWQMEKELIFSTLDKVKGNKTKAAEILGISVRTMRNKLQEYSSKVSG
ncbi:two-component system, response regulator FlrC [Syntrophus gentianae]|uniref:Two-component system, response regulator FlrC n=1 Tax=Syntrophus gentianae TaxID=43775 RepID=A0A1H7VDH6_9BACT|nr:sigma-54 dependent transcriptional regulator [Syntrophus gentianae]SEM06965.1 two-component system, response regulator FlrC [Syntrophus gentianae]